MRDIKQPTWLGIGIASVGITVGYMVGASATPVAGAAIPVVFGLIITAIGFLGPSSIDKRVNDYLDSRKEDKKVDSQEFLSSLRLELFNISAGIGKILFIFAVFYMTGMLIGAKTRIDHWLNPPQTAKQLPWTQENAPKTEHEAIGWIGIQERLLSAGYNESQIQELYKVYIQEKQDTKTFVSRDEFVKREKALIELLTGSVDSPSGSAGKTPEPTPEREPPVAH